MDKTIALSRIASLSRLPQAVLSKLADASGIQRIGKGSTLFREGERAHFVYVLVEGSVSLLNGPRNEEVIAEFMEAGDIILIAPALLQLPYMVTARAVSDLLVVMIPATEFVRFSQTDLAFAVTLNHILAGHWRLLLRHLTQTKSRDADTRLIGYLIDNVRVTKGATRVVLPGSKKALAAQLGITPETLSRSLKRINRLGVTSKGSEMHIADVSRLRRALLLVTSHTPSRDAVATSGLPK